MDIEKVLQELSEQKQIAENDSEYDQTDLCNAINAAIGCINALQGVCHYVGYAMFEGASGRLLQHNVSNAERSLGKLLRR